MSLALKALAGRSPCRVCNCRPCAGVISERNISTQIGAGDCDAPWNAPPMSSASRFAVVDRSGQLLLTDAW